MYIFSSGEMEKYSFNAKVFSRVCGMHISFMRRAKLPLPSHIGFLIERTDN